MTELGCRVKSCYHHSKENMCCRDNIKVGGCSATDCCSTCCSSYEKNNKTRVTNSTDCGCGNRSIEVSCDAVNCRYNEDYKCRAGRIDVKPSKNTAHGATECATFEML